MRFLIQWKENEKKKQQTVFNYSVQVWGFSL